LHRELADAALVNVGNGELQAVIDKTVPLAGHEVKLIQGPFRQGQMHDVFVVLGVFEVQKLKSFPHVQARVQLVAAAAQGQEVFHHFVFFVPDLAHQLFQDVFDGHNAQSAAPGV